VDYWTPFLLNSVSPVRNSLLEAINERIEASEEIKKLNLHIAYKKASVIPLEGMGKCFF
jgi:hypothetical protein